MAQMSPDQFRSVGNKPTQPSYGKDSEACFNRDGVETCGPINTNYGEGGKVDWDEYFAQSRRRESFIRHAGDSGGSTFDMKSGGLGE